MNAQETKQATFHDGFRARMGQLVVKQAEVQKQSGALIKYLPQALSKAAPMLGEAGNAGARVFGGAAGSGTLGAGARLLGEGAGAAGGAAPWYQNLLGNAKSLVGQHPMAAGAVGGVAGMKGIDEYKDYRRRESLRNMGTMDRLRMALGTVFSPESVIQKMRL